MSYLSKNSNVYLKANLTDTGRKLLAIGQLSYGFYKLGDSDLDYKTLGLDYNINEQSVLKPKIFNPDIKTWLLPNTNNVSGLNQLPLLQPLEYVSIIKSPEIGFFTSGSSSCNSFEYSANTELISQDNTFIPLSGMTGGNTTIVRQDINYVIKYEPKVGDLVLVKMNHPNLIENQVNNIIDLNVPTPYLWFKISATTGSLSANTLQITVDRNLPNFIYTGNKKCETKFYPLSDTLFDDGLYSAGTVWNQNIVWGENMVGLNPLNYEQFKDYGSESFIGTREYYGYNSEITGFCETKSIIGVIHYSNIETCDNLNSNKYGDKFYINLNENRIPYLHIPTLMWHKESFSGGSGSGNYIGSCFKAIGGEKFVTLSGVSTDISYYDIADKNNYVVGRVFPQLQTFTIDDQELNAALSYKSNRNWTLPKPVYDSISDPSKGLYNITQDVYFTYTLLANSGVTGGLHSMYINCINFESDCENCPGNSSLRSLRFKFPPNELPYMNVSGGTGFKANLFAAIVQVVPKGQKPHPNQWRIINLTNSIQSHTPSNNINPINLESSTFIIDGTLYNSAPVYQLNQFINLPQINQTNDLQFGDERFFYGNINTYGELIKYRTVFNISVPPNLFNLSNNPTWQNSLQNPHVSEIGIYDNSNNLVAIGKFTLPIEKTTNSSIIIQMAIEF
jgi:hypothetical protein